jgi:hypothetical protein
MIFWSGLFMVLISFITFVMFCDPVNEKRVWLEDACAAVMMMGFGIAVIGIVLQIGRWLA